MPIRGARGLVYRHELSTKVGMHRDAVMLANGRTLLLQRLHEGQ